MKVAMCDFTLEMPMQGSQRTLRSGQYYRPVLKKVQNEHSSLLQGSPTNRNHFCQQYTAADLD